ncbi:MAG: Cys-tRNA(Pro)/Cys-tRNA(Cys) deacylase YbaK [Tenericutes bacterium ADurb.BinA155]|nr:MAG: Cys-tRNA(Pro)/Cys-tRNA(Cys) deacylase YbaK [Tenericutes bacterium ADurb.BinA155]
MEKTNVMRLLDIAGISYEPREYDPFIVDGLGVATALGEDPEAVFKTLVTVSDKKVYFVFCVPVGAELDLKKAAKAVGAKAIEMIPLKELLPLTGYLHGGCSPIGLKKPFKVTLDETAQLFDKMYVSGGKRGFQVGLKPVELANYCHAEFVDLTKAK